MSPLAIALCTTAVLAALTGMCILARRAMKDND